ncbi:MAG: DUF977 family protein, partial [Candidatus Paceibacterota bacterium]
MYIVLFLVGLLCLIAGYVVGRRSAHASTTSFEDADLADEMGKKGRAVVASRIARRKERIIKRAEKHNRITNDDVEDLFCIGDATARKYLNELVEAGRLTRKGS